MFLPRLTPLLLSRAFGCFTDNEYASLLLEGPSETDNVLTKEAFDALWDLHDTVLSVEVSEE